MEELIIEAYKEWRENNIASTQYEVFKAGAEAIIQYLKDHNKI